ncbi:MAG: hypothetical protein CR972_03965 [Candidatus Moraniibacteriota bacterium]|nr:MAG: hypothetical protein CR972_03965 [Candidatus Moranbacteria bacterium]
MKKKLQKTKKKIISAYAHKHPLLFFMIVFNVFVITVIFVSNAMIDDLDMINAKRILFHQPDPELQREVEIMLAGYPMVEMAPYIAAENRKVAAFLVAIGKKESAWGKRSPKLHGKDCYNYWGFRRKDKKMGSEGHTCFDSPEQAVRIVARRIHHLIKRGYDTPEKMVLWKCGDCTGPESVGAGKWIQDVDLYYKKMIE